MNETPPSRGQAALHDERVPRGQEHFGDRCSVGEFDGGRNRQCLAGVRDDLLGATIARSARMQHAYEDRIAALRTQVDLVTSRQLLDQQAVENRVETLMARQAELGQRASTFSTVLNKAKRARLNGGKLTIPAKRPVDPVSTGSVVSGSSALRLGSLSDIVSPYEPKKVSPKTRTAKITANKDISSSAIFKEVENSLKQAEAQQIAALKDLEKDARTKVQRLRANAESAKLRKALNDHQIEDP